LRKLIELVKQALVYYPNHWLGSLIFAAILLEKDKVEEAEKILRNAHKPPDQYWLSEDRIDAFLAQIQAAKDVRLEDSIYSFTQFYLDEVKAELDDMVGSQQCFQKRWAIFQDILGSRYITYLQLDDAIEALRQNKLERAEAELTKVLNTGWDAHVVISFLLKIAAWRRDNQAALGWMKRLIEEKRDTPRNQMTVIHQLQKYEYYEEAEKQIEQATSIVDHNQALEVEHCKSLLGRQKYDLCRMKLSKLRAQYLSSEHQAAVDKMWDRCLREDMGGAIESDTWVKIPFESIARPQSPVVSVLVSTYDAEQYIEGCLRDLLSQTIAPQLEIIIIDSSSPGNEKEIIQRYQQRFQNIIYERTSQRESLYKAWNRALQIANAPFVTNANTDDRHRVDALERQAEFLSSHPQIDLVYGNYISTQYPNRIFASHSNGRKVQVASYSPEILYKQCLPGPQPMWRRSIHNKFGLFDPKFRSAGDYEFWIRISESTAMHHLNEYLGIYLFRDDSLEHQSLELKRREGMLINKKHNDLINSFQKSATFKPSLDNTYVRYSEMAK
jgi:glycosyltransferase involved in cell wall biosynthesis